MTNTSSSGAGGNTGIGVVPSALSSTSLTSLTGTKESFGGTVDTITVSGGTLTSFTPYAVYYTQIGGDGAQHVYTANISNSAVAPTPHQVSSLSVPVTASAFDSGCIYQGYQVLTDPTTAFLVVEIPTGTNACGSATPGNSFVLLHLSDISTTAPTALPSGVATTTISSTYTAAGTLTGLLLVDSSSRLGWYTASGSGTILSGAETIIKTGVSGGGSVQILSDRAAHALAGGSVVFAEVTDATNHSFIYRVDSAGAFSLVYTATGSINSFGLDSSPHDNTNAYFYDATMSGAVTTAVAFYKVPIAGGNASLLYTDASPGTATYQLIDSDGSHLIYTKQLFGTSVTIFTLATGAAGPPSTLFTSTTVNALSSFLDYGSDHLFVNSITAGGPPSAAVYTPSSSTPIGGQGGAGTYFMGFNSLFSFGSSGPTKLLELTGLTEAYPSFGLGSLFTMDASSFARVQVTQNGSNYVVPTGDQLFFFPSSLTIGAGATIDSTNLASGLVIDVSKSQMITVVAPNTDVFPD